MRIRECDGPAEYPRLVAIWRSAVEATHDFLAEADRAAIESQLADKYFPGVRLTVAEIVGEPVGFAGTAGENLEMLFVHADARGHGVGTALLDHAIAEQQVRRVDVNEQNEQAIEFYVRRGFVVTGRSELDDAGRPYPLLHMEALLASVLSYLDQHRPGDLVGAYLYGSAATSGLRPDSDIDLLVLTRTPLSEAERASLVSMLLSVSGWRGHATQFPEVADRRPLELTSLAVADLAPLPQTPRRDFQFGEWLRAELLDGHVPLAVSDPDVIVLLATAQSAHRVLRGQALDALVAPVPSELLRHAQLALLPELLNDPAGEERFFLLTLARMLVTIETGQIVAKDVAAQRVAPRLTGRDRALLELAGRDYLGLVHVDWRDHYDHVVALVPTLVGLIRQAAGIASSD
ncbi:acetyltransferase [Mycolicibacter heraklionensis]|uniref:acetyltransferase n=1 Tax=Mycolicibacter heraklionensis TaxID=512402 RepID=UPI0009ED32E6|nr:acetyltransferase [Mycolicibacter heraklionensis]